MPDKDGDQGDEGGETSMADETENHAPRGWYEDPDNPTRQRYWNGSEWTSTFRNPETQAPVKPVRFRVWFWLLLIAATLGILWGAAEQHDQGCYNKALAQVASGNTDQANCLLLPWNDPAEGSGFQ